MERFRPYFSFRGRTARLAYWRVSLVLVIFSAVLSGVGMAMSIAAGPLGAVFFLMLAPAIFASLALGVRRLHDREKSGWWGLVFWVAPSMLSELAEGMQGGVLALIGLLFSLASIALTIWGFVEIGFLPGTRGPNRYGDDPLRPVSEVFA